MRYTCFVRVRRIQRAKHQWPSKPRRVSTAICAAIIATVKTDIARSPNSAHACQSICTSCRRGAVLSSYFRKVEVLADESRFRAKAPTSSPKSRSGQSLKNVSS